MSIYDCRKHWEQYPAGWGHLCRTDNAANKGRGDTVYKTTYSEQVKYNLVWLWLSYFWPQIQDVGIAGMHYDTERIQRHEKKSANIHI